MIKEDKAELIESVCSDIRGNGKRRDLKYIQAICEANKVSPAFIIMLLR